MNRRKSVKIGEKDSVTKDEWYTTWYGCPECGDIGVARDFNYCPNCGIKLEWEEEK